MKALLKNISNNRAVSVIDKGTGRVINLNPHEEAVVIINSIEDIKDYERGYGTFGIKVSVVPEEPKFELPAIEEKPVQKKRRSSKKTEKPVEETPVEPVAEPVETVEVENVTFESVE